MFRTVARFGLLCVLLAPAPLVTACSGGHAGKGAQSLPKAGSLPDFGEWTGVWFSPTYGYLHLVRDGGAMSGKWRTVPGDKWGTMHGEVNGDLFVFDWEETTIGMVGPTAKRKGKGFFQYKKAENDEIHGEWGIGDEYRGVTWGAVKQKNMKPDPESVMPDETQRTEGGGWDDEKKKKPAPSDSSGGDDWK